MMIDQQGKNEYNSFETKDKETLKKNLTTQMNEFSSDHPSNSETISLSTTHSSIEIQEEGLDDVDGEQEEPKQDVCQQNLFEREKELNNVVDDEENQCDQVTTILSNERTKYSNSISVFKNGMRCVSSECAICLEGYALGEKVTWSPLGCNHAFHQECIVEWLMTLGEKACRDVSTTSDTIMQHSLCKFDMVCPICRKDFIANAVSKK